MVKQNLKNSCNNNPININHYQLDKPDWRKYYSEGLIPYILDTKVYGNYKLVEVKENEVKLIKHNDRIFLISSEKTPQIQKTIDSINNLTNEYVKIIDLYRQQLIGIIEKLV